MLVSIAGPVDRRWSQEVETKKKQRHRSNYSDILGKIFLFTGTFAPSTERPSVSIYICIVTPYLHRSLVTP